MISLTNFAMDDAVAALAVANTPHFLARKLKEAAAARSLAQSKSSQDIQKAFQLALKAKPKSMEEAVWPYLLLAALHYQGKRSFLLTTAKGGCSQDYFWLSQVADIFSQTPAATNETLFVQEPKFTASKEATNKDNGGSALKSFPVNRTEIRGS
jgi:hypothetical protein